LAPEEERRLAAIMFTDVVGYTAITERDEERAVRIRETHRELVRTLVKQFDGELVDATGDESFSIFASALRAVDCALALQGALRSHPDLRVRIGIHLGDVLRRDGEVIGEGVNVAARVRPLAEPGGICVSEPVYQMVRSRSHVSARALGARALKNVSRPLPVYSLAAEEVAAAEMPRRRRRSRMRGAAIAAVAIAVLALTWTLRAPILTWLALNVPHITGGSVDQQVAFAETSDGVRIAYATSGEGPPIVFVLGWGTHLTEGLGSPLYDQSGFLTWYTRENRTVRYDGRGFGLSDRDITDFSLDARVRDVETVVDALGLDRFALYAYSAGGAAGIAYADRHPERVTRLVLAATFASMAARDPERARELEALFDFVSSNWDTEVARASFVQFLAPGANDVQRRVLMHFFRIAAHGPQLGGFFEAGREIDVSAIARRLRVPTLVVAGSEDSAVPVEVSRNLASLIPGSRFEILEGASHIEAAVSDPRTKSLVAEFLAEPALLDPDRPR
jgi:class 3 adenylate cyclase/pimeloyl-ACP methyl ester carboxylesterase